MSLFRKTPEEAQDIHYKGNAVLRMLSYLKPRAMALRCFCPPERVTPRSPTMVSYPSGKSMILSRRRKPRIFTIRGTQFCGCSPT